MPTNVAERQHISNQAGSRAWSLELAPNRDRLTWLVNPTGVGSDWKGGVFSTVIPDNEWFHVVGVFDSDDDDTLRLYINGVEEGTAGISGAAPTAQHSIKFYQCNDASIVPEGNVSLTHIFDYAHDATLIAANSALLEEM